MRVSRTLVVQWAWFAGAELAGICKIGAATVGLTPEFGPLFQTPEFQLLLLLLLLLLLVLCYGNSNGIPHN